MTYNETGVAYPFGMPVVGVDQLFEVAHQYGITGLIDTILLFLAETCHPNDVLGHISADFSLLYDEVYRMYEKVLAKYSEELKGSPELEAFCQSLVHETNDTKRTRLSSSITSLLGVRLSGEVWQEGLI